jgi:hypothetical protein
MRAILTAAAATLTLAACTNADWGIPPSAEELASAHQAWCVSHGYPVGHPEHAACRSMLDRQPADAEMAMRTEVMANPGAGPAAAAPLAAALPPPPPPPAAPPIALD